MGDIGGFKDSYSVVFKARNVRRAGTISPTPSLCPVTGDGVDTPSRIRPLALEVRDGRAVLVGYGCGALLGSTESEYRLELDCFGLAERRIGAEDTEHTTSIWALVDGVGLYESKARATATTIRETSQMRAKRLKEKVGEM